jgi:hypothetical protein
LYAGEGGQKTSIPPGKSYFVNHSINKKAIVKRGKDLSSKSLGNNFTVLFLQKSAWRPKKQLEFS